MRPSDLSGPDRFAHGTRACYVARRCRCELCRAATTAYYHARRARELVALAELEPGPPALERPIVHTKIDPRSGRAVVHHFANACPGLGRTLVEQEQGCPWGSFLRKDSQIVCLRCRAESVADYLVDAGKCRRKIRALRKRGIGRRSIADAAGVASSSIGEISRGTKTQVRLSTEARILNLDAGAAAGGTIVDASPTQRLIGRLLEEGFTRRELAKRLGYKSPALQLGGERILARNALRVAKFYRAIMAGADEDLDVRWSA
ncbi:MAG TPA: hypothetical protein VMR79_03380 [Verrucomicrobiae bacterium]|nr:hypothetical protein [Verrucomicrobiae bacterium]